MRKIATESISASEQNWSKIATDEGDGYDNGDDGDNDVYDDGA